MGSRRKVRMSVRGDEASCFETISGEIFETVMCVSLLPVYYGENFFSAVIKEAEHRLERKDPSLPRGHWHYKF